METVVEVVYRAIAWDNYQGGSGTPFTDRLMFSVEEHTTIMDIQDRVCQYVDRLSGKAYLGEVFVTSVQIIDLVG